MRGESSVDRVYFVGSVPAKYDRSSKRTQAVNRKRRRVDNPEGSRQNYDERPWLSEKDGRVETMLTETDETDDEPRSHARKFILNIVRRRWVRVNFRHTFDWKVKTIMPVKMILVVILQNNVNDR